MDEINFALLSNRQFDFFCDKLIIKVVFTLAVKKILSHFSRKMVDLGCAS